MCLWLFELGVYHNLYFMSDALHLVDVFENLRNVFPKAYNLDPSCDLYASTALVWQVCLNFNGQCRTWTLKRPRCDSTCLWKKMFAVLFLESEIVSAKLTTYTFRTTLPKKKLISTWSTYLDAHNLYMDGVCDKLIFTLNIQRVPENNKPRCLYFGSRPTLTRRVTRPLSCHLTANSSQNI